MTSPSSAPGAGLRSGSGPGVATIASRIKNLHRGSSPAIYQGSAAVREDRVRDADVARPLSPFPSLSPSLSPSLFPCPIPVPCPGVGHRDGDGDGKRDRNGNGNGGRPER